MRRHLAVVTVALPLLATAARPQDSEPLVVEAPEERPVFGSGLDLVNVTITVRDQTGRLIPDLVAEDFVVYEDGRPQKAVVFGSPVMLGGGVPLDDENYAVNLGLLLDTSESMLKELRLSQEAAVRFLRTSQGPGT